MKGQIEKRLPSVHMNSISREEARMALNKRTGWRLNASFNIELCGGEELFRERAASGSCY